jgi:hypothetical protein
LEIARDLEQGSRLAAYFPDSVEFPLPGGSVSEIQGLRGRAGEKRGLCNLSHPSRERHVPGRHRRALSISRERHQGAGAEVE